MTFWGASSPECCSAMSMSPSSMTVAVRSTDGPRQTSSKQGGHRGLNKKGRARRGVLFILAFITSIAGVAYGPVLSDPNYIASAGADTRVFLGAFLELLL